MAALFTKFDPRAFLNDEWHAADGGRSAKLATLAALAGPTPNSENWLVRDAILTTGFPVENLPTGVRAAKPAKPAKPAKDRQRLGQATSSDAGQAGAPASQAAWSTEDWRARFDERAGFLEHDGGWSRLEAEVQAFEQCIVEWLNANPTFSPAGRCAWCGKAETPSARVLPFGAGEHHEWLHAECWAAWYQRRREEAVLALRGMGIAPGGSLGRLP